MSVKAAVIRGVVIPRLLFGAEIYGMNKVCHRPPPEVAQPVPQNGCRPGPQKNGVQRGAVAGGWRTAYLRHGNRATGPGHAKVRILEDVDTRAGGNEVLPP